MNTIVIPVSNQITHNQQALAPMPFNIGVHDRIRIGEADYGWVATGDFGHVLKRKYGVDAEQTFSHADLWRLHHEKALRHDRNWYLPNKAKARIHAGVAALADIPPEELPGVLYRFGFCQSFMKMEEKKATNRSDIPMADAIEVIHSAHVKAATDNTKSGETIKVHRKPSVRTLRRWLKIFADHDFEPIALRKRNRHRGPGPGFRLDVEVQALMTAVAVREYVSEKKQTKAMCYRLLLAELATINDKREAAGLAPLNEPGEKTFRGVINGLNKFMVYAGRNGLANAKKKFKLVTGHLDVVRPGERIEMDEWSMPLIPLFQKAGVWDLLPEDVRAPLLEEERRWSCSVALDVATGAVLGLRIAPSANGRTNCAVLKMVGMDKSRFSDAVGALSPWRQALTPETVATDGGKGYVNDHFRRRVADLGATHLVPPGGTPQMRAYIERLFLTMRVQLATRFKGQTFMDVVDRGDYPSEQRKNMLPEAIAAALVRYIVDQYHNTPHEGLGGETPLAAWDRLTNMFGVVPPPSAEKRRHVFGEDIERTLSQRGIRMLGLYYRAPKLGELYLSKGGITLDVRFDPDDIGRISVCVDGDWHGIACATPGLDGISAFAWVAAASDLRQRFADQAKISLPIVHEAIQAIGKLAEEAELRAGVAAPLVTADHIKKAESGLLSGFEVADDDRADTVLAPAGDIRGRAIPVSESVDRTAVGSPDDRPATDGTDNLWLDD
ncbi:Mu transposase C-terminal domain-containing protein [Bosea thiooxidans]